MDETALPPPLPAHRPLCQCGTFRMMFPRPQPSFAERLRQKARETATHWLTHGNGRNDPVFRYAEGGLRAMRFLRTGQYLAVVAPFDPGAWTEAMVEARLAAPNALDAEGNMLIGLIGLPLSGGTPSWTVPQGPQSVGLAVLRALVRSRCRSGEIAGITLQRGLFGPARESFGSTELIDAPMALVTLEGFVPRPERNGEHDADGLPGDVLAPASSGALALGGVFRATLAPEDIRTADMPTPRLGEPDWRVPLLPHNRRPFTRAEAERLDLAYEAYAAGAETVPA